MINVLKTIDSFMVLKLRSYQKLCLETEVICKVNYVWYSLENVVKLVEYRKAIKEF